MIFSQDTARKPISTIPWQQWETYKYPFGMKPCQALCNYQTKVFCSGRIAQGAFKAFEQ
jgi:hypothetical protein